MPDLSPPGTESDFYFVQADDPETAVARIVELAKTRIPKRFGLDPIREEASRLGFFHEVVEPDKLLATAVSYARCIAPDCNIAYAMSKKALQDGVQDKSKSGRSPWTNSYLPA